MGTKSDVAEAARVMRQTPRRGLGRKSPIYCWMEARHAALAALFEREPPSWVGLARYFAGVGLMDTNGDAPTPAAVRSAWLRVDASARRQRQGVRTAPPAPKAGAAPVPPAVNAADDGQPGDEPLPDDFEFTPIQGKR